MTDYERLVRKFMSFDDITAEMQPVKPTRYIWNGYMFASEGDPTSQPSLRDLDYLEGLDE